MTTGDMDRPSEGRKAGRSGRRGVDRAGRLVPRQQPRTRSACGPNAEKNLPGRSGRTGPGPRGGARVQARAAPAPIQGSAARRRRQEPAREQALSPGARRARTPRLQASGTTGNRHGHRSWNRHRHRFPRAHRRDTSGTGGGVVTGPRTRDDRPRFRRSGAQARVRARVRRGPKRDAHKPRPASCAPAVRPGTGRRAAAPGRHVDRVGPPATGIRPPQPEDGYVPPASAAAP